MIYKILYFLILLTGIWFIRSSVLFKIHILSIFAIGYKLPGTNAVLKFGWSLEIYLKKDLTNQNFGGFLDFAQASTNNNVRIQHLNFRFETPEYSTFNRVSESESESF